MSPTQTVITPEVVVDVALRGQVQDADGRPAPEPGAEEELRKRYRQHHALSWWRVVKVAGS